MTEDEIEDDAELDSEVRTTECRYINNYVVIGRDTDITILGRLNGDPEIAININYELAARLAAHLTESIQSKISKRDAEKAAANEPTT